MYFDYDFDYLTDNGDKVLVQVSYLYEEADPYSIDSDWDYAGCLFIDEVCITLNGEEYKGNITEFEIRRELLARLRDRELEDIMENNLGF